MAKLSQLQRQRRTARRHAPDRAERHEKKERAVKERRGAMHAAERRRALSVEKAAKRAARRSLWG